MNHFYQWCIDKITKPANITTHFLSFFFPLITWGVARGCGEPGQIVWRSWELLRPRHTAIEGDALLLAISFSVLVNVGGDLRCGTRTVVVVVVVVSDVNVTDSVQKSAVDEVDAAIVITRPRRLTKRLPA